MVEEVVGGMTRTANHSMQRMGASRSGQRQFERPRRLAPTADAGRWPKEHAAIHYLSYAESLRSPYMPLRHHSVRQPSRRPESHPGLCAYGYHDGMRSLFTGGEETTAS